jgi:hypothetical protein
MVICITHTINDSAYKYNMVEYLGLLGNLKIS